MNGQGVSRQSDDYHRIEKAIHYIETHFKSQPTLKQMAESIHLSKYHFDRLFKRWAGISPIQFLQFTTLDYTKGRLAESKSLFDTALDAGLSGPSRLHDLFVTFEAMTPGDFKKGGWRAHLLRVRWLPLRGLSDCHDRAGDLPLRVCRGWQPEGGSR